MSRARYPIRALTKPVLARNCDLTMIGARLIVLRPVRHFVRAIFVDRTSDPERCKPEWLVFELFRPDSDFHLTWGTTMYDPRGKVWSLAEAGFVEALQEKIDREALPPLRSIQTFEDFIDFVDRHEMRHFLLEHPASRAIVAAALGDLATAQRICEETISPEPLERPGRDERGRERWRQLHRLCALVEVEDRPGIAALLSEWEAAAVRRLKLEHLWEPSPFPVEHMTA